MGKPKAKPKKPAESSSDDDSDESSSVSSDEKPKSKTAASKSAPAKAAPARPAPLIPDVYGSSDEEDNDSSSSEDEKKKKRPPPKPTKYNVPKMPDPCRRDSFLMPGFQPMMTLDEDEPAAGGQGGGNNAASGESRRPSFMQMLSGMGPSMRITSGGSSASTGGSNRRPSLFGRDNNAGSNRNLGGSNRNLGGGSEESSSGGLISPMKVTRRLSQMALRVTMAFKTKEVTFPPEAAINQIREIDSVKNLEKDVIDILWFSEDEIQDIKHDMDAIAAAMDAGFTDVDGRGLEGRTEEGKWQAYKARSDATNAVLDEQDRQNAKRFLKNDEEEIRKVYLEVSTTCTDEAANRGKGDEKEVIDYLAETREQFEAWKRRHDEISSKTTPTLGLGLGLSAIMEGSDDGQSNDGHVPGLAKGLSAKRRKEAEDRKPSWNLGFGGLTGESPLPVQQKKRVDRKKSWFVRATETFSSSEPTVHAPGVGFTSPGKPSLKKK